MNTRRLRDRSEAVAAFRWLGWVMLMMFVLVQPAQAAAAGTQARVDATQPHARQISEASAQFDPATHQVTVEAPAPVTLWNVTPEIGAHSFVVYEDNLRQPLEDVKVRDMPLSIGVLLEHGGRYHALNDAVAQAGSRAIQELEAALNPDDQITVWTYADTVEPLKAASPETPTGLQLTTVPVAPSSESNFYDAVLTVLPRVQQMAGRKALVVVSTGIDTFSQADFPQVLRAAADSGVPICPINIGPLLQGALLPTGDGSNDAPYRHLNWQLASQQLSRLARVSGCRALVPSSSLDLPAVYDGLLANLRLKYVIRYQSSALNLPGTREVRVEWTDGSRAHTRVAHANVHSGGSGQVFADARYTVDADAVLGKPTALTWPFLPFSRSREIHIRLQDPMGDNSQHDG